MKPLFDRRKFLHRFSVLAGSLSLLPLLSEQKVFAAQPDPLQDTSTTSPRYAEGVVYHDRNGNGKRDAGEEGIKDVCVSNGREVVKTDAQGKYRLPVDDDTILFVIKPSGWMTPVSAYQLPQSYYIHKPNGSPQSKYAGVSPTGALPASVDFALRKQEEPDKFRVVLFGDPQPRNQKEIDFISHDVVEELIGVEAAFGLSLGDEMFDDLSLYDSLNGSIANIGIPWYNVLGNHDMNYDSPDDRYSTETFQRIYGPAYRAFNHGPVHFLILENVVWEGQQANKYHGGLGERQLAFVKNDLAQVPKDRLVVVAMHIPLTEVRDREALYRLLEDRPYTLSLSAHTHVQEHFFLTEKDGWKGKTPHHHLNHVTVCGSWWRGAPDERGIPHATMTDGGPNGYSFLEFDKNRYTVTFHAARRGADYQMSIHTPESVTIADAGKTEIIANIFAGSERSTVEMRLGNGNWTTMQRTGGQDPYFLSLKEVEKAQKTPLGIPLPDPTTTKHLWKANLPTTLSAGTHLIQIRTTDMFGQKFTAQRIIRVVA